MPSATVFHRSTPEGAVGKEMMSRIAKAVKHLKIEYLDGQHGIHSASPPVEFPSLPNLECIEISVNSKGSTHLSSSCFDWTKALLDFRPRWLYVDTTEMDNRPSFASQLALLDGKLHATEVLVLNMRGGSSSEIQREGMLGIDVPILHIVLDCDGKDVLHFRTILFDLAELLLHTEGVEILFTGWSTITERLVEYHTGLESGSFEPHWPELLGLSLSTCPTAIFQMFETDSSASLYKLLDYTFRPVANDEVSDFIGEYPKLYTDDVESL